MASEKASTSVSTPDIKSAIAELEVPFPPDQVQWRVTNTAKDKKRGQIVPYADPRAYADRLNALFTAQGWTRKFQGSWVDLDQNQQPKRIPALPAWAIPENWRKGIRPPGRNGNGNGAHVNGGKGNGHCHSKPNGGQTGASTHSGVDELDTRIVSLEKAIGPNLYRSVLREYGKAAHPRLIMDEIG